MRKCANIWSQMMRPLVILYMTFRFATAPFWISLYLRKILFSFYQCIREIGSDRCKVFKVDTSTVDRLLVLDEGWDSTKSVTLTPSCLLPWVLTVFFQRDDLQKNTLTFFKKENLIPQLLHCNALVVSCDSFLCGFFSQKLSLSGLLTQQAIYIDSIVGSSDVAGIADL